MRAFENYTHPPSGVLLCREIAQPQVTTFAECFPAFAAWDFRHGAKQAFSPRTITGQAIATNLYDDCKAIMQGRKAPRKHADQSMDVGPFLSFCRYERDSLAVSCADWVLSRIREKTIIVPHDRMSFELVTHDNGWTLVVANHSQILGSVWLAYIQTDSIPQVEADFPAVPREAVRS